MKFGQILKNLKFEQVKNIKNHILITILIKHYMKKIFKIHIKEITFRGKYLKKSRFLRWKILFVMRIFL